MKRRWLEYILNLFFWLLTTILLVRSFSIVAVEHTVENGVETQEVIRDAGLVLKMYLLVGVAALLFYVNCYLLQLKSKWLSPLKLILRSLLLFLAAFVLYNLLLKLPFFSATIALPGGIVWGCLVFYFTISVSYGVSKNWIGKEFQAQKILAEKKQAELNLLRSQLHPHFLFNVLNNLLSLVDQERNPDLAAAIDKLSGLLRHVIEDGSVGVVPIKKEIEFLKNYADLQKMRFVSGEVNFKLEVVGSYDEQMIEPGLFIPFLENAFKYGAAPEMQTSIVGVFSLTEANWVDFKISNEILAEIEQAEGLGTGIKKTKERLELVYPGRHELQIKTEGLFEVHLKVNTDASDNH